jgi:glutathione peroxidase-family protein
MKLADLIASYTIDGNKLKMAEIVDSPVLMINVASKCGSSKRMYQQIHDWHKKYPDSLKILLFPCGEFGDSELPQDEIKPFLETFEPTKGMPLDGPAVYLMDKCRINGRFPQQMWEYARKCFPGKVRWNFEGIYLFSPPSGTCIGRWDRNQLDAVSAAIEEITTLYAPRPPPTDSPTESPTESPAETVDEEEDPLGISILTESPKESPTESPPDNPQKQVSATQSLDAFLEELDNL